LTNSADSSVWALMKITHIVPAYHPEGPGGIELYSRALVAIQAERGHEVVVLTGCAEIRESPVIEWEEVDGHRVARLYRDDLYFVHHAKSHHPGVESLVAGLLEAERPDVIHVHHWLRLTSNLVEIADRLGIPALVTLHDYYTSCPRCYRMDREGLACTRELSVESCAPCVPRWGHEGEAEVTEGILLFREQYHAELGLARAVVTSTEATAEGISRLAGVPRDGIEVLPLAHPRPAELAALTPGRPPAAGEALRFASWGRVSPHKGVGLLLEALAALGGASLSRPVEVHILGEFDSPELERELRSLAEGLPVHFHGAYEARDLSRLGLHVGVFPSLCLETHSYALDECFALGLPSIVSDAGALAERAGASAIAVPMGDAAALAGAMAELADAPGRLAELAAALPAPGLDLAEHAARLERLYERVRATPRSAGPAHPEAGRRAAFLATRTASTAASGRPECEPR